MPAGRTPTAIVMTSESGARGPDVLLRVSHGWFFSFIAAQDRGPVPAFEIRKVSVNVVELPALAMWATLPGRTLSTGCCTVKMTGIFVGDPVTAPASTITVSAC